MDATNKDPRKSKTYEENLKIYSRAKEELHNLNKEKISKLKDSLQTKINKEPLRSTRENASETLHLYDNNLSNTKQFEPVSQNKEKMFCACILEKHEIKYCESKRNIYKIDLIRNQIMENKLDEELEKDWKVK